MKTLVFSALCLLLLVGAVLFFGGCLEGSTPDDSGSGGSQDANDTGDDDTSDDDGGEGDDWSEGEGDGDGEGDGNGEGDGDGEGEGDDEEGDDCTAACEKLIDCGRFEEGDEGWQACLEFCEEELNPDLIVCILEVECDAIESCYEGGEPEPEGLCIAYCEKLIDCDRMAPEELDECFNGCMEETPWDLMDCVLGVECEALDECFEHPWPEPNCGLYCAKLIGCDRIPWWEYEECVDTCFQEPPEVIECVIEVECDAIEECYEQTWPEELCGPYCDKMVDCGFFHPMFWDLCFGWCLDEPIERIECVLDVGCDEIEGVCFE